MVSQILAPLVVKAAGLLPVIRRGCYRNRGRGPALAGTNTRLVITIPLYHLVSGIVVSQILAPLVVKAAGLLPVIRRGCYSNWGARTSVGRY